MHAPGVARWLPALVGAILLACAQSAGAATFCVVDPSCPADGIPAASFQSALTAAGSLSGRDRIRLGPTTFTEPGLTDAAGNAVDIVGSLADQTTIAAPPSAVPSTTFTMNEPASTISDVVVEMPQGTSQTGLALAGTAQDVTVIGAPPTTGLGVSLGTEATFAQGVVGLPQLNTTAVSAPQGKGTLQDSAVAAATGIVDVGKVQRVNVTATTGIQSIAGLFPANVTVDDARVEFFPGIDGTGLVATQIQVFGPYGATLTARHVTVIGNGEPGSIGVQVNARGGTGSDAATASATISSTILRGLGTDLSRIASGGVSALAPATADLTIDYSDYDPLKRSNTIITNAGGTHGAITDGPHSLNVDPGFRDAGNGDFALRAGSPLIDRGDPAPLAAGESTTDLNGNPRVLDGDGDGVAIADIGAFEGPRVPFVPRTGPPAARPALAALALTPARFAIGAGATARSAAHHHAKHVRHGTTIHFTLSRAAIATLTIQRPAAGRTFGKHCVKPTHKLRNAKRCTRYVSVFTFTRHGKQGKNAIAFSGRAGRNALAPGSYRLQATATADHLASAPRTARFTIVKP